MAGLRAFKCYRRIKRAYTRKSKFKKKGYIKAVPNSKIVKYVFGDLKKTFPNEISLISKSNVQIRHNALESCRQVVNRHLHTSMGPNYLFRIRLYPHHILREKKILTGAGADRMSKGMQLSFGKATGIAAQVKQGQKLFSVFVDPENLEKARDALSKARPRLPNQWSIIEEKQIKK